MRWFWMLSAAAIVLLVPAAAWGWGPFTHLLLARSVVTQPALLPPEIAQLITVFAVDYIYGNLAADFVIAKNLATNVMHAHNWRNGLKLLHGASTPGERAFALGYLSHLAADNVSHNYFVPFKLVQSFADNFSKHTYWEARFDGKSRALLTGMDLQLIRQRFPENDALHARHIQGTLFDFPINRFLFRGIFRLQSMKRWQHLVELLARHSTLPLADEERHEQIELSLRAIRSFLHGLEQSPELSVDPRGSRAIAEARRLRLELRRLLRASLLGTRHLATVGELVRPSFRRAVQGTLVLPRISTLLHRMR